ncbi:MAG TPA: DUF2189 domain-containing protein [Stellaceae bacterium]|nr:DUF2189 domain-containing protein [Stellaceae bacterium]
MFIRNPIEWSLDQFRVAGAAAGSMGRAVAGEGASGRAIAVRRIEPADLVAALHAGVEDFKENRSDVVFLCIVFPILGFALAKLAVENEMLPMLFPLASGFALVGPIAAVGLYEMSRRREQGIEGRWPQALAVVRSPAFGKIVVLGLLLAVLFVLWIGAAALIYALTLGPGEPASLGAFLRDTLTTRAGWAMIVIGFAVGFLFALVSLAIGTISFPMLLDRDVSLGTAIATSARALAANPRTMAIWGLIVALSLALATIPLFLGLIVVMPVLGHATWHLYRRLIPA